MLTQREQTVGGYIKAGLSNKQIAAALGVSLRSAKFHVSNLLRKTATANRAGLARALENDPRWLAEGGDERPVKERLAALRRQSEQLRRQKRLVDALAATCAAYLACGPGDARLVQGRG